MSDLTIDQAADVLAAAEDIVDRPELALTFWALIETAIAGIDPATVDLMFTMATDDLAQRRRHGRPVELREAMLSAAKAALGWTPDPTPATTNRYPFNR